MDTLYTFLDKITHYETKKYTFGGLMNSATKKQLLAQSRGFQQFLILSGIGPSRTKESRVGPGLGGLGFRVSRSKRRDPYLGPLGIEP